VSNQPQYSAIYRVIEAEVLPTCRELGLGQIVWSPLGQGVLTGKYRPGQPPPQGSRATDETGGGAGFIRRLLRDEVLERVEQLRPLAEEAGLSMAGLALAWVLQEDDVASAIIGASRPEQVHDNVRAVGVRLDPQLKRRMEEVLAPVTETDPALTRSPNPRG
jgi:aryl-alcohol dehydrogenase-like predicted oxidoreductase